MKSESQTPKVEIGLAGRIAQAFIDSKLTPLVVITSVLLGVAAILLLPREEEPQIRVPMIDVLVAMPGFRAKEVEERATRPMEKLLWEIPGVEYIYSTSRSGESLAIVRFKVGENVEKSLVKLNQKLQSNFDRIPQGVSRPLIKPRSIDDVPILALTFHSAHHDHLALRRLVAQVDDAVKQVPLVAETVIIGGAKRQLRVQLDPLRLASRQLGVPEIVRMLGQANRQSQDGGLTANNRETLVETGGFLSNAQDVGNLVVAVYESRPVYLREVADIKDSTEEPSQYVFSGIVAIAIPTTLALTVLAFYLYGYTLNRITLFALIFSVGILVDDAIVVVENIVRHFHLPQNKGRNGSSIAVEAVNEVGNATILATFAVIAAVLPMAFVGGLSGPYMSPTPLGAGVAMFFSLGIAFVVTPWASIRILRWGNKYSALTGGAMRVVESGGISSRFEHEEDFFTRIYRRVMRPMIAESKWRYAFLAGITALLVGAIALVGMGWVKLKMLPFDNKSEFQIILNMPEGSALERTAQCAREIAAAVRVEPEVTDYQIYTGVAAPYNFNGLVRHYFMRRGANIADLQINLVGKAARRAQSHAIAKRVRSRVTEIASRFGARVAIAEVPPGPPVLQTLVAEIYGQDEKSRLALADKVIGIFTKTPGVVDTDWYVEADQPKARFIIDKEKAALSGISAATIAETLRIAVGGMPVDLLHVPRDKEDVDIVLRLPRASRTTPDELLALRVRSEADPTAPLVPLRELVKIEQATVDKSIYHKNLMPVTYVIGDVAGVVESPAYAILQMNQALHALNTREFGGSGAPLKIHNAFQPFTDAEPSMKWDGEWQITIEVFRDLGTAFAAVLVLIFILLVGWFRSFLTPLIVMAAIPFSLVGILPAHGAMGAFFTATSMIGFMAGAGIVVRNSIILVDFIEQRLGEGMPLAEAVVDAGAVRFRPMLLTALAVVVGAAVILADPIFQGLAIALMAGEIASLLGSRMAVPVLYFIAYAPKRKRTISPATARPVESVQPGVVVPVSLAQPAAVGARRPHQAV